MPPTTNAALVSEQIWLAHRYRNALVELERNRRAEAEAVLRRHYPDLDALESAARGLDDAVEVARLAVRATNQRERRRTGTPEQRQQIAALRNGRKVAWAFFKERRKQAWADEAIKADLVAVNAAALAQQKALRSNSSLYWGNYLPVEQAASKFRQGSPPQFRRWDHEGKVAVQLQGGLSVIDVLGGGDTRLQIYMQPLAARSTHNKRGQPLPLADPNSRRSQRGRDAVARVRVGTADDGRSPIWADVPFIMLRPLPEQGRIKWAYLHRRRVGTHDRWQLQFVVEQAGGWPLADAADAGTVAVNLGWRKRDAGLRVAYWVGANGRQGELLLPWVDVSRWGKSDGLRSIRDGAFDVARDALRDWFVANADGLPAWLTERTATLPQWRSAARLAAVAIAWRGQRFAGDEDAFAALEAWRTQDKHLLDWERAGHGKAIRWRDDLYRAFVRVLRRQYHTVLLGKTDWKALARVPQSEEEGGPATGNQRRIAAPGRLQELLKEGVAECRQESAVNITRECHVCGTVDDFDAIGNVTHQCTGCGCAWDIDENACRVLLKRAGHGSSASGEAVA